MIAISSYRPRRNCGGVKSVWGNQAAANESWVGQFSKIVYFNELKDADVLHCDVFMTQGLADDKPTIKEMAAFASHQQEWVCLINADIVLDPNFKDVTDRMIKNTSVQAAVSGRYNFQPPYSSDSSVFAEKTDNGLDVFLAHPAIWRKVAQFIPKEFKLGRCGFDTWLLGFFNHHLKGNVADLTWSKLVFHPIHEDRGDQSTPEQALKDPYMSFASMPVIKITA